MKCVTWPAWEARISDNQASRNLCDSENYNQDDTPDSSDPGVEISDSATV